MKKFNFNIIILIMGILCILFSHNISHIFHYIIGLYTIILASYFIVKGIKEKEYKTLETKRIATGLVMVIMGIIIILKQENSLALIGITWGIFGLIKGIDELNIALYNYFNKRKFLLSLIHSSIEIILAVLLIYDPFGKLSEHILLLGIDFIIMALKMFINNNEIDLKSKSIFS